MKPCHYFLSPLFVCLLILPTRWANAEDHTLNIICSAAPATCNALRDSFVSIYDIPTNIVRMSSGEALDFIEKDSRSNNPTDISFDVWWGGTGDTHLKAVKNGLMHKFVSSNKTLLGWSTYLSDISDGNTVGVYAGMLGIVANKKVLTAQNLDLPNCWSDLGDPKYRGQLIIADPNTSGTAYTFLSTIFQIYDPFQRIQVLAEIKENILKTPKSGSDALLPVANDDAALSVAFIHDVPLLEYQNPSLAIIIPCEGTGYEIGAASILKSTEHLKEAKMFIEYTLLASTQNVLTNKIALQMYSNANTLSSPVYNNLKDLNVINYNFNIYSRETVRNDVLSTWNNLGNVD